ncbi:MAG: PAS domain S-box protein [Planctomycetales bacterium]|nr:PAS domain S-box protein [Planctomycetales bacterium]
MLLKQLYQKQYSPLEYFAIVLGMIFVAEVAVMFILPYIVGDNPNMIFEAFMDGFVLTLVSAPLLVFVLIRPLKMRVNDESKRISMILEFAQDMIVTTNSQGKIESINRASMDFTGYTAEELLTKHIDEVLRFTDLPDKVSDVLVKLARLNESRETFVVGKTGSQTYTEIKVSSCELSDGEARFTIFVSNIEERKLREQENALSQKQAIESANLAGKAEVATSVLHNVGNVLTSLNIIVATHHDRIRDLRTSGLQKTVDLIKSQGCNLATFLADDKRGKQVPVYLEHLAQHFSSEHVALLEDVAELSNCVEHATQIVSAQQQYARTQPMVQHWAVDTVIEASIAVASASLARHRVDIQRFYHSHPIVDVDRSKLMQVLVNILNNGKDAVKDNEPNQRRIVVEVESLDEEVVISISDNGIGVDPENLSRIFSQGFTTKKEGHGFGLHYSALAIKEMKGEVSLESEGLGKGATFVVRLPLVHDDSEVQYAAQ